MKEKAITNKILKYLNSLPGTKAIKLAGCGFAGKSTLDILCCAKSNMLFIEVKVPGKKPTIMQAHNLHEWSKAGAVTFVAYDLEDVKTRLAGLNII
jgi:Holliday junction resolvase